MGLIKAVDSADTLINNQLIGLKNADVGPKKSDSGVMHSDEGILKNEVGLTNLMDFGDSLGTINQWD